VFEQTPTAGDLWTIGAVALLQLVAVWLALAETSLTRMTRIRAMHLEEQKRPGARQLVRLVENPATFLNLVLLLVLIVQSLATALFNTVTSRWFGSGVGVLVSVSVITLVTFVLAEVAPKTYAVQQTDRVALRVAPSINFLTRLPILGPLTKLLITLGNWVTPGKGLRGGPFAPSEDEVKATVDEATKGGEIEAEEREMIHSIFEFGDTILREVMVPRPDVVAVPIDSPLEEVLQVMLRTGYSRIPVYAGDLDEVQGLAYAKDVLRLLNEGRGDKPLAEILREPPVLPESMRAADALREMRRRASHMAIVIDEYGGTAGLVTLEDLLEEIVGEIADEYDREEPNVEPLPDGGYRVNARLGIDEVNDLLGAELPDTEWDTIGGLLFNLVGRVPTEGQEVDVQGLRLRAERVQGHRVGRVRIHRVDDQPGQNPGDHGDDQEADVRAEARNR
jgi:CBS domain containing-hemolysin-like protein